MAKIKLSKIKPNPNNPRIIKDDKFKKLVQSLQEFPEMMEKRPMVCVTDVDGSIYPLGGNMRLKALQELKLKEIPSTYVMMADEWTEERRREFVIKDNVGFGEWDWEQLANDWDTEQLNEWGLDVPEFATEVDYSILDDEDVEDQLADMTNGVKKAIQIEFEAEHYEEAYALVKFWREQNAYVGGMIMEYLKEEKNKI
jgi:ParB-like chromosome segregation protein Spo0J